MTETSEPSDQRPEEGHPEYVPDDTSEEHGAGESPGVPGEEETGTGNPDAAGVDEGDQDTA
jgi:hypothetical protein